MKKILIGLLTIVMVVALLIGNVQAANDFTVKMTPDKTIIYPGDTVKFTFQIADIDITAGVGTLKGKLEYDKNIFEKVVATNFTAATGWGNVVYNDQNDREGEFIVERASGDLITSNSNVFTVEMKVKTGATVGKTDIKLSNPVASNNDDDISIATLVYSATVSQTTGGGNNNTNNTVTNNTVTNNTVANNTIANNTSNNTSANTTIPKAGAEDYIMPAIMGVALVGIIAFIRYKKIGNI